MAAWQPVVRTHAGRVPPTGQPQSPANLVSRRALGAPPALPCADGYTSPGGAARARTAKRKPSGRLSVRPWMKACRRMQRMNKRMSGPRHAPPPAPRPIRPILTANAACVARCGRPHEKTGGSAHTSLPVEGHRDAGHSCNCREAFCLKQMRTPYPKPLSSTASRHRAQDALPRAPQHHPPQRLSRPQNSPSITCNMPQKPAAQITVRR